jgi:hypothetical protein
VLIVWSMDHGHSRRCPLCENTDIQRVLRRQEDYITNNRNSIFSITGSMHSQEEVKNFESAFILEIVHSQKRQIEEFQAKNTTSASSNARLSIGSAMEEIK